MFRYLYIILLSLILCSCSKAPSNKPIPSNQTVASSTLQRLLEASFTQAYADHMAFGDDKYILPTEEWIRTEFTPQLSKFLFDNGTSKYVADQNDCDKFALYGMAVANILNRHNSAADNSGIAVGECQYYVNNGFDGHAINFIIVSDKDKKIKILFYEPQTREIINLNTNTSFIYFIM